jgi:hypothetical protein
MLVIVFVGVTVAVIVVVRMPIAMVVATGLASRMVMSAACRGPCLSLLGKQLHHTLFEVGVRFRREVVNYGYWLETRRFHRTQQGIG